MPEERGHNTYREITTQGEAWNATLAEAARRKDELAAWLEGKCAEVVFTGCGSTFYLSLTAAAVWRAVVKKPAHAWPASEMWLSTQTAMPRVPSLFIAVSRSGETSETLRAVEAYRAAGGRNVLCITVYPEKPLARMADFVLVARESEEISLAQTRSFTSMLWLAQAAALAAAGRTAEIDTYQGIGRLADGLVRGENDLARRLGTDDTIQRFTFLGSGLYHGIACEAMLKMKEMSQSLSEAFRVLEFRHGPKAVVGPDMLIVGLVSEAMGKQEMAVLEEMRDLGARVLPIVELPWTWQGDEIVLESGLLDENRAPAVLPFLQLLAYYRAIHKGLDPDNPANLSMSVQL